MASFTQDNRPLRISTPLGKDALLLERISGNEGVSTPFMFTLDLLSESKELNASQLLGKLVTVTVETTWGEPRFITGIIARFVQAGYDDQLARYRAELVPDFWMAGLSQDSRIFQEKTVADIVTELLKEIKVDHQWKLTGTYEPRNYCVQYRESNLAFISRLLEEEGIHYYFVHTESALKMVMSDLSRQAPPCAGLDNVRVLRAGADPSAVTDSISFALEREDSVITRAVTLRDDHFELPGKNLETEQTNQRGADKTELYDYPGGYTNVDGVSRGGGDQASRLQKIYEMNQHTATARMREIEGVGTILRGKSNCPTMTAGHSFTLKEHYRGDFNADYLILRVHHEFAVENYLNRDGSPFVQRSSFDAIPLTQPYAPPRLTPRAVVRGSQTARVVGPDGTEIFTDKYGRVMVQFNWDREGKSDANSSCWVRVATPWAGKQWGVYSIPRVGAAVVVDFLEGDPDRPIITGMVYNAEFMPPYPLPDNKTRSGIKTRSTLKGTAETFNEIRFEDKKDAEEIYVHAEKDLKTVIENNEVREVGLVKKDPGTQTVTINGDQTLTVKEGKQTVTVSKGDQILEVTEGKQNITVKGDQTTEIKQGNQAIAIKMGNHDLEVAQGNQTITIKMGNQTTKAKMGKISQDAMQGIELKVGQSSVKIDQQGVTIKGMKITLDGKIKTEIKGLMTDIKGTGMLKAKGGITMIN
ncbi:MAG TPA: type VI secretion system tip protein TssI/VgrG [Longimicrobiaceae bacterium]|nr:type VI secretion system tip protein TssI/VgrG [Longimicrobiaceae bacterium]